MLVMIFAIFLVFIVDSPPSPPFHKSPTLLNDNIDVDADMMVVQSATLSSLENFRDLKRKTWENGVHNNNTRLD